MHSVEAGVAPRMLDRLMEGMFFKKQKSRRPPEPEKEALYRPTTGLQQRSGTRRDAKESSLYSRGAMHPVITAAAVVGAGLAVTAMLEAAKKQHEE